MLTMRVAPFRQITSVACRQIHARGYTNFDDHWSFIHNEINFAFMGAKNTDNIVFVY
jgi:hypothetical protein